MTLQPDPRFLPASSRLATAKAALRRLFRRGHRNSLRTTIAILKAQQEATLDGILVIDQEGKVLSYNRRFLEIWRIPPEVANSTDEQLLEYARTQVLDWSHFITEVEYLYQHPREVRTGQTIALNDGRILSRTSVPVIIARDTVAGRAWYFRDITEEKRAEHLQSALFRIAQLTRESENLDEFYRAVHRVINELMEATNFYIAEYDKQRNILTFPYFVDQYDSPPQGRSPGHGLTSYVLRTGEPLLVLGTEAFDELAARGEVEQIGAPSIDWLGVPLKTGDRTWGVIGVQTYDESKRLSSRDKDVLVFVAQHVASAIEQKRQEDALRESERRYRQMFENNRAVQLLIDPGTGDIVDANMAACDFYGYPSGELKSMHIWDINVLGSDRVRSEMNDALSRDKSFFVFRHMRSNGEIRDVEVHSGPVDIGGRRLLYSIIHDITERRRAEQALQQSEEKYRNIFKHAPVGILQTTRDGHMITANTALAHMLGYGSVDELLQVNAADLWLDSQQRDNTWDLYEPRGSIGNLEVQWKKKDGTTIWVQVNAHVVKREGDSSYVEGFVYDVTERKRAEAMLASASAQRKAVLEAATRVSIIATDPQGVITVFNSGAERMLGYSADAMIGQRSLLALHLPEEIREHCEALSQEFKRPISGFDVLVLRAALEDLEEREWTYVGKQGERRTVLVAVTALRSDLGDITGFLHVASDITERKQNEEMLHKQSAAITASMDGIGILNEALEFTYLNDSLARLYGYPKPQSMIGKSMRELYDDPEVDRLDRVIIPAVQSRGRWRGEATGRRRDGFTFPQEISLTATDGGMICIVRDVTERTYAEEQIKHLAYHDALTGLPNRLLFKDRLTVALSHAQRDHSRLAVLFLDLDRFKVINDSLGHNVGDQLLQAVATRVQSCVRDSDTVARLGGDEFTLLLPALIRSEDAALVAQKIIESVRYPFHIEGREFFITTSIGISLYPEDGADAATLIKNADTAMYQAKEQGRDNYQLFNAFVNAKALQRIALEHGLRRALANQEMTLFYQPIFDFRSERITGMEALLRWTHPDMGSVPPAVFIPLAEATGVMVPIGGWVLRTACRQAKAWHDAGYRNLSLAVNLSVTQLQQPDLVERVKETLDDTGLRPDLLELEITESSAMQSPEMSVRTLIELKKLGLRVSLDDFGTGHSSLSYLKRFPIDTLKIDQSFVRDITTDTDTSAIVTAIIAMAHSLRMKVIAEGVEQPEQSAFLKRHTCDQMQGFLVKPPVPAIEFLELMRLSEV
ncbi:MAG TPA: EAL domain-containing protein [Thermoanaerobaculia bacterium]|nr:EAL domain-containing protein [Thermoanaerobaculia bacterium]